MTSHAISNKAIITCAITGVLTDPGQHHVPVTPEQLAKEARRAYDAGAAVVHVHFRNQEPGKGHLPSWDPQVARDCVQAMREACPGLIINQTTGVVGPNYQGPLDCLRATRPEMAACNAGSLNYLKVRSNGTWAWPPMPWPASTPKPPAACCSCPTTGQSRPWWPLASVAMPPPCPPIWPSAKN